MSHSNQTGTEYLSKPSQRSNEHLRYFLMLFIIEHYYAVVVAKLELIPALGRSGLHVQSCVEFIIVRNCDIASTTRGGKKKEQFIM